MKTRTQEHAQRHDIMRLGMAVAAIALACAVATPSSAADVKVKLATMGMNDMQHDYLREFKRRLEAAAPGVTVELYPGGQLGGIADTVRGLQLGTVEMFVVPPDFLKGIDPRFGVVSAPGVFQDLRHANRTFTDPEFRSPFLALGEAKGVKGLSIWVSGASDYATLAPVRTLADFKGLKIRVLATEVETKMMARLGAAGVPMDIADVLPALQRRALDGIRSIVPILDARKFWTTTKYLTVVNDTDIPLVAWVSMPFYSKLSPQLQQTMVKIGVEMEPYILERALAQNEAAYVSWTKNGGELVQLSKEERAEFMKRVGVVADEVMGADPQIKDMYALFKKVAEKTRNR